ncbi:MAG: M14 family zinc carboxypeptidase [Candidatus Aminicenantales bacterium]
MKIKVRGTFFCILLLLVHLMGFAEVSSLSNLLVLGKGIKDLDGDSWADRVSLILLIPDNPTACEVAVAADIAARANLECLAQDLFLVKKESEISDFQSLEIPVWIGTNLKRLKKILKEENYSYPSLAPNQGFISLLKVKNKKGILLVAGSDKALLQTGRAFFLRWPYIWEIWGREEGVTYFSLEKDLSEFFAAGEVHSLNIAIQSILYEFPPEIKAPGALKKFSFDTGQVKDMHVEISFTEEKEQEKAFELLESLRRQHSTGQRTDIFSYPGCAQLTFTLRSGGKHSRQVSLPRMGYPKRLLTPSYKDARRPKASGKEFDLLSFFSAKGIYADSDKDGILDSLDSAIIIPRNGSPRGVSSLASRLVLSTAGASFPIVYLDEEIENKKSLTAPILIGPNSLTQELLKMGKWRIPPLKNGRGMVQVIPKAFNESNALALVAADEAGLEKTLDYFSATFPYFDEYTDGRPQFSDLPLSLEKFLKGEKGSAEAYFIQTFRKTIEEFKDKELESLQVEIGLPRVNPKFEEELKRRLTDSIKVDSLKIRSTALEESQTIFEKEKEFPWEGEEALRIIEERINALEESDAPLKISLTVSESPAVRQKIKERIERLLAAKTKAEFEVEVLSAYKQGFFWLVERVLPRLKGKNINRLVIQFTEEQEDLSRFKRFYSEPFRWLQELYPVDEILAGELGIPLEKIDFEMKAEKEPVYRITAYDSRNAAVCEQSFSPRIKEIPFLNILPEWGTVKVTTGGLRLEKGTEVVCDLSLPCDLEKIWDYYQQEILKPLYAFIMKKTGSEPSFSKQPYFKRLLMELWVSEPDYRLGLDEEIISSLEAMHDELYFDTLDFLRGITELDLDEEELPEDTSRLSAPGNVFPVIHPSTEGQKPRLKVVLEDRQAAVPQMVIKWKEKGHEEYSRKVTFPSLKGKSIRLPAFVYDGVEGRVEKVLMEVEFEKESEYLALLDLLSSYRALFDKGLLPAAFSCPNLNSVGLQIKCKDLQKEEVLPVSFFQPLDPLSPLPPVPGECAVDTGQILSPEMCLEVVRRLSYYKGIKAYIGGESFENRKIPVLEIFKPMGQYVSVPRLIMSKPTLYMSGRQHANEVSSTNYILKFAELLATHPEYQKCVDQINFVLHPMENPDGAALAYELQKLTPFHSLHAGRYSSLGIDVGSQIGASKPILPEALVRKGLFSKWQPDIYLNLHGYPSHEWVQPFSNYSPYLFRDYWIPRGWFAYYKALSLPIYRKWKEAGDDLRSFIISEMQADEKVRESNKKFYDRYFRWAARWQPHLDYLDRASRNPLFNKVWQK